MTKALSWKTCDKERSVKKYHNMRDIIYGRPLTVIEKWSSFFISSLYNCVGKISDEKVSIESFKTFHQDWSGFADCHFSHLVAFVSHVPLLGKIENAFVLSIQGLVGKLFQSQ